MTHVQTVTVSCHAAAAAEAVLYYRSFPSACGIIFGSIDSFDNAAAMLRAASWGYDVLTESRIKRGPAVRQSFEFLSRKFF